MSFLYKLRHEHLDKHPMRLASTEFYENEIELLATLDLPGLEHYAAEVMPLIADAVKLLEGQAKRTLIVTTLLAMQSIIMGKVELSMRGPVGNGTDPNSTVPADHPDAAGRGVIPEERPKPSAPTWESVGMAVLRAQFFTVDAAATAIMVKLGHKHEEFNDVQENIKMLQALIDSPPDGWMAATEVDGDYIKWKMIEL